MVALPICVLLFVAVVVVTIPDHIGSPSVPDRTAGGSQQVVVDGVVGTPSQPIPGDAKRDASVERSALPPPEPSVVSPVKPSVPFLPMARPGPTVVHVSPQPAPDPAVSGTQGEMRMPLPPNQIIQTLPPGMAPIGP